MGPLRRISAVKPGAQEFAVAAERHLDDVHAFLIYLTGDRNVAEELTAETFARACERWRRYDPRRGSARTWLCQLARSTALEATAFFFITDLTLPNGSALACRLIPVPLFVSSAACRLLQRLFEGLPRRNRDR